MLISIETFFGRFHPLIVHLPIGFLVLAVFLSLTSFIKKYRSLRIAVPFSLLIGSLSAAFACITGYVLSLDGDYDTEMLDDHMWAGILTTFISFVAYLISIKKIPLSFFKNRSAFITALVIIFIFISITGHLGGSLTHGSDYISASVLWDKQKEKKKITNLNDAYIFAELVQPILEDKCGNCHNESKKKGKLSIASYQSLIKGGKHGAAIKPGNMAESELIKRISLNPEDKKFMPTDGKTPLTAAETFIIKWWIDNAASGNDIKFAAANPPEEIKKYAAAWLRIEANGLSRYNGSVNIKTAPVSKDVLNKLKEIGFVIKYLNYKPDILDVTLPVIYKDNVTNKLKALSIVKENILWLNVSGTNVSDDDLNIINQFKNIQRLRLDNTPVTNNGITKLKELHSIQSLNIYGTRVTKECIPILRKMPSLRTAYIGKTKIAQKDVLPLDSALKIIGSNQIDKK
jgi:uncharacterized membrane protein